MRSRATVICLRNDAVLFVRKAKGRWALPGGKIENGETPSEAACRELAEETRLADLDLIYLARFEKDATKHFVFFVKIDAGSKPTPANEIVECRWQPRKRIECLDASPATKAVVKAFAGFEPM